MCCEEYCRVQSMHVHTESAPAYGQSPALHRIELTRILKSIDALWSKQRRSPTALQSIASRCTRGHGQELQASRATRALAPHRRPINDDSTDRLILTITSAEVSSALVLFHSSERQAAP